jgi:Spherulation-specific family 4
MVQAWRFPSAATRVRVSLALSVLLAFAAAAGIARAQSMAVPAYFYPGSYWTQLDQAGPGFGLAVMNPDSGPGTGPDANYLGALHSAQAAGIRVVGYVYTSYGSRSLTTVESDINAYYSWYPSINGIFLDEASTNCAREPYYAALNAYVKSRGATGLTVLNPGTQTNQCYEPAADILLTFEGSDSEYVNSYSAPSWVAKYPASHFWHVIYSTPTVSAMSTAIQLSKTRNAGYVYVTSATLPNPYDVLPVGAYWSDELSDIASATSGTGTGGGGRHHG